MLSSSLPALEPASQAPDNNFVGALHSRQEATTFHKVEMPSEFHCLCPTLSNINRVDLLDTEWCLVCPFVCDQTGQGCNTAFLWQINSVREAFCGYHMAITALNWHMHALHPGFVTYNLKWMNAMSPDQLRAKEKTSPELLHAVYEYNLALNNSRVQKDKAQVDNQCFKKATRASTTTTSAKPFTIPLPKPNKSERTRPSTILVPDTESDSDIEETSPVLPFAAAPNKTPKVRGTDTPARRLSPPTLGLVTPPSKKPIMYCPGAPKAKKTSRDWEGGISQLSLELSPPRADSTESLPLTQITPDSWNKAWCIGTSCMFFDSMHLQCETHGAALPPLDDGDWISDAGASTPEVPRSPAFNTPVSPLVQSGPVM